MARAGRRSLRAGALVGVLLIGAACGDDTPRDDDLVATRDGLLEAIELSVEEVDAGLYGQDSFVDTDACPDLPEDDRWAASRGLVSAGSGLSQEEVLERSARFLEDDGFEVERLRATSRGGGLGLRAARDDLVVLLDISPSGGIELAIFAGPCAPEVARFREGRYEPLEDG